MTFVSSLKPYPVRIGHEALYCGYPLPFGVLGRSSSRWVYDMPMFFCLDVLAWALLSWSIVSAVRLARRRMGWVRRTG
jgi:hypothetical protein